QQVLLGSRKPSTRSRYLAKWKRFSCWCALSNTPPLEVSQSLAVLSIRVPLATISTFHPGENGLSVFSNPMVSRFLKGLEHLYPQIRHLATMWDLSLVLSRLMGAPFEPMATCLLLCYSWKTAFVDQKGFGLQLVEIDSKHHIYILVSNLPRLEVENLKQDDCTANLGLLTVILSFLFVKGNAAKESAVWELLRRLQVDPGVKHEVFGAVKKLVTEEFVRQKYLEYNRIPHTDPPEFEFQWGAWAAKETSKMLEGRGEPPSSTHWLHGWEPGERSRLSPGGSTYQ
uniref:MAGE domain-containing protein n=1 Tax=Gopherus agassizii TaxID=38772 RepID=A0A452HZ98_9SAUR